MIVLDLSILNQKGTPMFNSDTFANRPAFGIVGRIFISTDTKEFFRDTGTSWELIGGPGSGTITGSGAATQVAFWNSASTITGSNNLWYDSTNSYLGVNTNAPGNPLDVHGNLSSVAALNQTTATNNTLLSLLNSGTPLWRIGNFYTAGANDFGIFDVVNTTQQLTIVKSTGQTFIGAKTTASGRLVVNTATADAHLQVVGANAPSIRIDNAGSGGTQRFVFGLATATNNFIQGAAAGQFCISTQSAGNMLFGMWQTTNASEVMRITTANNLLIGSSVDNGNRFQVYGKGYINDTFILDGTNTAQYLNFYNSGVDRAHIYWQESLNNLSIGTYVAGGSIQFEVGNNVDTMFLNSSGQLSIGTNIVYTGTKLQVSGSNANAAIVSEDTNSTGSFVRILGDVSNQNLLNWKTGTALRFATSASDFSTFSEIARFSSTGNLLVGTTTDGGQKLQVTGTATFSSTVDVSGVLAIGNSVAAAVAAPSTHKVSILIGGVQYYLLASNV